MVYISAYFLAWCRISCALTVYLYAIHTRKCPNGPHNQRGDYVEFGKPIIACHSVGSVISSTEIPQFGLIQREIPQRFDYEVVENLYRHVVKIFED